MSFFPSRKDFPSARVGLEQEVLNRVKRSVRIKYWQVAECGININVGNVQSWERQAVLDSAEEYGIDIVADWVANNVNKYRGYWYHYIYHLTYESTGYESYPDDPKLQGIEAPIIYDFEHEVGEKEEPDDNAEPDRKDEFNSWRADAPASEGYLLWNYNGTDWLESGRYYYVKFRLKINGDTSSHDQVARIEAIRISDGVTLGQMVIYSDDFADVGNITYKEFQLSFNANRNKQPAEESSLSAMLPTGEEMVIDYEDIDFRIYWYGEVTTWADNIKVMNSNGKTLLSGSKDADIMSEVEDLHTYDSDYNTLIGFYQDEPRIFEIETIHYLSNLMYNGAPQDNKNVVMQPAINRNETSHQYLNMGSPETYEARYLLRDIYPIRPYDAPSPGDNGYTEYIQNQWENYLIPRLENSRYVADLNGVPFWFWLQAHNWPPNPN